MPGPHILKIEYSEVTSLSFTLDRKMYRFKCCDKGPIAPPEHSMMNLGCGKLTPTLTGYINVS